MNKTNFQKVCEHCGAESSVEGVLLLEIACEEDLQKLGTVCELSQQVVKCSECESETRMDRPFSVYYSEWNRLVHYFPWNMVQGESVADLFDVDGSASSNFFDAVIDEIAQDESTTCELLAKGMGDYRSFSFHVYLTVGELFQNAHFLYHNRNSHWMKMEYFRSLKIPNSFLERGSRLYKKNKLRFVYCLGQMFADGRVYTKDEVYKIIAHERPYLKDCDVDNDHAHVALIELELLERTSDGSLYWRRPDSAKVHELVFPSRIGGYEKAGYKFYGEEEMGFSVAYRECGKDGIITFYVYGAPEAVSQATGIEAEFARGKEEVELNARLKGHSLSVVEERELVTDREDGRAEAICQVSWRLVDGNGQGWETHLLVRAWRGRFIKVRKTVAENGGEGRDSLLKWVFELLKRL